jgi:hypothetical protein
MELPQPHRFASDLKSLDMGSKTVIFIVQAVTLDRLYKIQELANLRKTRAIHLHAIQPDTPDIRSCAFPIISLPISRG